MHQLHQLIARTVVTHSRRAWLRAGASALAVAALVALIPTASATTSDSPWSGSGTGTTVVVSDGSSAPAEFVYDALGPFNGSWTFSTTAAAAGTVVLDWDYSGDHSWFQVTAKLEAFIDDGSSVSTFTLIDAGPEDCCTTPSNGFAYSGSHAFTLDAGDEYGFIMTGSHFDSARLMRGTLIVDENLDPDCSGAAPSVASLWPPNHAWHSVDVVGVTDPDGDPVAITIDSVFQDEAVNARGSGNTSPDGAGVGTGTASVRAERVGSGNGRVYTIGFTASDGNGGSCTGTVQVGVPHDQSGSPAVDDGALYDSTATP